MPQISKFKLHERVERELTETFLEVLIAIDSKQFAQRILDDLLTPTEKIMLGKRLLIAILLQQGYGYREIVPALKVSPGTINVVRTTLTRGGEGFKGLFRLLEGRIQRRAEQYRREARRGEVANRIFQIIEALQLPAKISRRNLQRWRRELAELR